MGFTLGFGLGWFWEILSTFAVMGLGCALKDRRQAQQARDRVLTGLRVYWKTGRQVHVVRDPLVLTDIRETVN